MSHLKLSQKRLSLNAVVLSLHALFATCESTRRLDAAEPNVQKTREELLNVHNQERKKENLKPLQLSRELTKAAQEYAEYLAESGEFSHTAQGTPRSRVKAAGYEAKAGGENIATGQSTAAAVVKGWMESDTHKGNILSEEFTEVGFGIATAKNGDLIWVADYATRVP